MALLTRLCRRAIEGHDHTVTGEPSAEANVDWEALIRLAEIHGLGSLVASQIPSINPPPPARDWLRSRLRETISRQMLLTNALARAVESLQAEGVPAVAVKGPVLAKQLYGDRALREYMDLDILVRREMVTRARSILEMQGYVSDLEMERPESSLMGSLSQQISLHNSSGIAIDLHWSLHSMRFPNPVPTTRLWEGLDTVTLGETPVRTLGQEDLLLYLCSHGARHQWRRLCWLVDLARWLRLNSSVKWEIVEERARSTHCERMIAVGLELVRRLFEVQPEAAIPWQADDTVRQLATAAEEQIRKPADAMGEMDSAKWTWRLLSRPSDRFRYISGVVIAPTVAEWQAWPLARKLHFLYYPFRILRLAHKYCRRLVTRL